MDGHYQLGRALARQGRYSEARGPLERAIEARPDLPEAYYQVGRVYVRLGEKDRAEKAFAAFEKFRAGQLSEQQEMSRAGQELVKPK